MPDEADYFGYIFLAALNSNTDEKVKIYKRFVKKEICDTREKADIWLYTSAYDFLKTILETYKDGKTLMLLPNTDKWITSHSSLKIC